MVGNKILPYPNGWRGQVVQIFYIQGCVETYGSQNLILNTNSIEEEKPIKIKTWANRTISGCLEVRVGGKQVRLGNSDPTRDIL